MEERIQKILAAAGYGSRRSCEDLIMAGRVTVNGEPAHLGSKADIAIDHIKLDGKPIKLPEAFQYIALYKPRGVISSVSSPDERQTVRDLVPIEGTLYPVGRLDADSEGLILLTNDGDLANQLTHPRFGHEKEYRVLVARHPDEKQLTAWRHGVVLEDGYHSAPAQVEIEAHSGKGTWLTVIMKEGRKRQIRDTCRQIGLPVVSIIRVRIGSLRLGSLKSGDWRKLTQNEINFLKNPAEAKKFRKPASKPTSKPASKQYSKAPGKPSYKAPVKSSGNVPTNSSGKAPAKPSGKTPAKPSGKAPARQPGKKAVQRPKKDKTS
jgi:23S rRNA pseudouridine2605 synthase